MRVVLDTCILKLATFPSRDNASALVFELARSGLIEAWASPAILEEYADVLGDQPEFVAEIVESCRVCHPLTELRIIRHEPDNRFLECAFAVNADYIITVNTSHGHFDRKQFQTVRVITPKNFTLGYQDLWARVAATLGNVRLNTVIRGITRGDSITVTFGDGTTEVFDKLIVTCCLDATLPSLISDLTPAERKLFAKTLYTDYYTTAVSVESFPNGRSSGSYGEIPLPPVGQAWGVFKVWDDVDAAVYYSVGVPSGSKPIDGDAIYKLIVQDAAALGYQVGPIIESGGVKLQKQWSYFPHVGSDGLNDHYLALEALQGQKNSFYSGGLLSFETVHNVVTYSKSLVARRFPSCPGSR